VLNHATNHIQSRWQTFGEMNKSIIYILLITIFASCEQKPKHVDISDGLKWKTFDIIAESEKDTLIIDFNDSTYLIHDYRNKKLPFRISTFDDSNYLVLGEGFDRGIMAIKKNGTDFYKGLFIGEQDFKVKMVRRKPNWNKEMLYGKWTEEYYLKFSKEQIPPPVPPIPTSKYQLTDEWPPYYQIENDKITLSFYQISESAAQINNSAEFITMDLYKSMFGFEQKWRIKDLNDSVMIINRLMKSDGEFDSMNKYSEDIKLIKKR
jgi:hypothetical protein